MYKLKSDTSWGRRQELEIFLKSAQFHYKYCLYLVFCKLNKYIKHKKTIHHLINSPKFIDNMRNGLKVDTESVLVFWSTTEAKTDLHMSPGVTDP